jgi:hypothetical protein
MKRCKTCGKLNWDGAKTCENCQEEFHDVPLAIPNQRKDINFSVVVGVILILVGIVLLVVGLFHATLSSLPILYLAAGITLLNVTYYHEKNDRMLEILRTDLQELRKELNELKEKNADK